MRLTALLIILASITITYSGFGQNQISKRTYRVTAYKSGDTSITSQSNYKDLYPNFSLYIPNAFTPNGDGINDTFGVRGENIGLFKLMVFDRWGQVLFTSSDANVQWDGKYQGHEVQQGAYAYKFVAQGVTSGQKERSGTVTVIR